MAAYLLILSLVFSGFKAQQGEDMTDDDYIRYAEAHPEYIGKTTAFLIENKDVIIRGLVGTGVGLALKAVVQKNPLIGGLAIGGATELAKEVYKNTAGDSKDERLEKMEKQLEAFTAEIQSLKAQIETQRPQLEKESFEASERFNTEHRELERQGHTSEGWETRVKPDGYESHETKQGYGEHDYRSDPKECGPHRDSYREHKQESHEDRKTRETVESTHRDPVKDRNYVEKRP